MTRLGVEGEGGIDIVHYHGTMWLGPGSAFQWDAVWTELYYQSGVVVLGRMFS